MLYTIQGFNPLCREQGNSLLWVQRREGLAFLKRNEVLFGLPLLTSSRSWKDVKVLVFFWFQPQLLLKKLHTSCNALVADLKERVKSPAQQALGLRWAIFQIRKKKEKKEQKNLRGIRVNINYTRVRILLINDNINPWISGTILLALLL